MTLKDLLLLSISRALLRHAAHASPPTRVKWAVAAASELESIASSYESLIWSVGTVRASYKERLRAMSLNEPQLPRTLLMSEILICFLPSSLLWASALVAVARSQIPPLDGLWLSTAASIGPIGLVIFAAATARFTFARRFGSLALALLAGWTALVVLLSPLTPALLRQLPWRDFVLLVLLPTIGAAHYALLERNTHSVDCQNAPG